jgi:prepilin-type N-terminal cleavage/methylation domain-containing protein
MNMRRTGFTLIELLVVIAIIGILIGLLFPAIAAIYASFQDYQCQNNMRQLAQVMIEYTVDFDGSFPFTGAGANPTTNLSGCDWLYVGGSGTDTNVRNGALVRTKLIGKLDILYCPIDQANGMPRSKSLATRQGGVSGKTTPSAPGLTSYVLNSAVSYGDHTFSTSDAPFKDGLHHVRKYSDFKPTHFMFIEESEDSAFDCAILLRDPPFPGTAATDYAITGRHRGGGYVSCMDGHVEWISIGDFTAEWNKLMSGSPWYMTTGTRFGP